MMQGLSKGKCAFNKMCNESCRNHGRACKKHNAPCAKNSTPYNGSEQNQEKKLQKHIVLEHLQYDPYVKDIVAPYLKLDEFAISQHNDLKPLVQYFQANGGDMKWYKPYMYNRRVLNDRDSHSKFDGLTVQQILHGLYPNDFEANPPTTVTDSHLANEEGSETGEKRRRVPSPPMPHKRQNSGLSVMSDANNRAIDNLRTECEKLRSLEEPSFLGTEEGVGDALWDALLPKSKVMFNELIALHTALKNPNKQYFFALTTCPPEENNGGDVLMANTENELLNQAKPYFSGLSEEQSKEYIRDLTQIKIGDETINCKELTQEKLDFLIGPIGYILSSKRSTDVAVNKWIINEPVLSEPTQDEVHSLTGVRTVKTKLDDNGFEIKTEGENIVTVNTHPPEVEKTDHIWEETKETKTPPSPSFNYKIWGNNDEDVPNEPLTDEKLRKFNGVIFHP